MRARVTSMLRSSSTYCWLGGNRQAWAVLGVTSWNNRAVTHVFQRISLRKTCVITQAFPPWYTCTCTLYVHVQFFDSRTCTCTCTFIQIWDMTKEKWEWLHHHYNEVSHYSLIGQSEIRMFPQTSKWPAKSCMGSHLGNMQGHWPVLFLTSAMESLVTL